jgi:hypothetical protein
MQKDDKSYPDRTKTADHHCYGHNGKMVCLDCATDLSIKHDKLKAKYEMALDFIKDFHANPSDEFILKARDLLREIGR